MHARTYTIHCRPTVLPARAELFYVDLYNYRIGCEMNTARLVSIFGSANSARPPRGYKSTFRSPSTELIVSASFEPSANMHTTLNCLHSNERERKRSPAERHKLNRECEAATEL